MNGELPESTQFYLDACDSISRRGVPTSVESLSPVERTIFRAYIFDSDQQMGGLTTFFYNTDSSATVAAETANALESIGASRTAALFREAAALICRPELQQGATTWGECLERVDPEGRLDTLCEQINQISEIAELLEVFVVAHRDELQIRNA